MKTIHPHLFSPVMPRRRFLVASVGILATAGIPVVAAESTPRLKAVVIGHTGRGDYGHGLEGIFANRPDIDLVALADPDPAGRAKTASKIGA